MTSQMKSGPYDFDRIMANDIVNVGRLRGRVAKIDSPRPHLDTEARHRVVSRTGLVMAELEHIKNNKSYTLYPEFEVGRSHACALRLTNRMVSGYHASFRWSGAGWQLRDLGSRNGTFVDGRKLEKGGSAELAAGSRVAFGDASDIFELIGDGPPEPVAKVEDGEIVFGEDDVLALPSSANPEVIIRRNAAGCWIAGPADAGDEGQRSLEDNERITVQGRGYRLILPLRWDRTWQPEEAPLLIDAIGLRFEPSRNREHVDIVIVHDGGGTMELPPRVHCRLLLELARARINDQRNPEIPDREQGWMSLDDLCRACDEDNPQQLNLQVHRAREQFRRVGVADASRLIEIRRVNGLRRIGVARLEIVPSC